MSITIHNYDVGISQIPLVIQGMRNSWESWEKSDSWYDEDNTPSNPTYFIGKADLDLALRLIKVGDDHGKYLRQIPIIADITAPEYWWKEMDQYKIGTTTNSTSMMHILGKYPFSNENLELGDLDLEDAHAYLIVANAVREKWINAGKRKATKEWRAMLQIASNAWKYRRAWSGNYQVLRHTYHARKNHRLSEWHEWCSWVEQLPYSQLITVERTK